MADEADVAADEEEHGKGRHAGRVPEVPDLVGERKDIVVVQDRCASSDVSTTHHCSTSIEPGRNYTHPARRPSSSVAPCCGIAGPACGAGRGSVPVDDEHGGKEKERERKRKRERDAPQIAIHARRPACMQMHAPPQSRCIATLIEISAEAVHR